MKNGIQTFFAEAGEAACYALSIIEIAIRFTGKNLDPVKSLELGIGSGCILYNWDDPSDPDNFYVKMPDKFLSILTGKRWSVEKVHASYVSRNGEYAVDRWELAATGALMAHFNLRDWDSLLFSKTVKYGRIVSRRVFRQEASIG